jgi:hypothetical protein
MFGILITPSGIGPRGIAAFKGEWIATCRMVICLPNQDLITMVRMKTRGDAPEALIERKVVEFRITL